MSLPRIYMIGSSYESMIPLSSFPVPIVSPKGGFSPGAKLLPGGDFNAFWVGFPSAVWKWDLLRRPQRDSLRSIFVGDAMSVNVYFSTSVNENGDEFRIFRGTALWPSDEIRDFGRRLGFSMSFVGLVEVDSDSYSCS